MVWKISRQSGKFPDSLESSGTVWKVLDSLKNFQTVWKVSGRCGKIPDCLESNIGIVLIAEALKTVYIIDNSLSRCLYQLIFKLYIVETNISLFALLLQLPYLTPL